MSIKIALAGNPNCGKTTMFNNLTGSSQYVGNWPGVTVEKKEGKLHGEKEVIITDLPGIYSLSPYTLEEVVSRNYLLNEHPDAIINLVDGTNLERNLYLTTQLLELGIPTVIALNMVDLVRKNGDKIDIKKLSKELGCDIIETSALKGIGSKEAAKKAIDLAKSGAKAPDYHKFSKTVEDALQSITSFIADKVNPQHERWYAIKLFERDEKAIEQLKLTADITASIENIIKEVENKLDDDSESIITNERYEYIGKIMSDCVHKKNRALTTTDKIDKVVTNRWLALPIFAVVMFIVYYLSISTVGTLATDWVNDGVFGDGWHLFGIGSGEYSEQVEMFEAESEAAQAAGTELTMEEPDPANYGVWVPSIPALIESGLDARRCIRFRPTDVSIVLIVINIGRLWIYGPCSLYYGQDIP